MSVIEALLDLQEVDDRIMTFEKELKDLPVKKAQEIARLNGASVDLKAAEASKQQLDQRITEYEEEIQQLKVKRDDLKKAQVTLKTNKEYTQFSIQIDQIEHDITTIESKISVIYDELPSVEERIKSTQEIYDAQKSEIDGRCAEFDERIKYIESELASANAERLEKESAVDDPKFKLDYERLRTRRWPVLVPLTRDGVCDGCHLQQPPSVAQLVEINERNGREGLKMRAVMCNMCGRMLYK